MGKFQVISHPLIQHKLSILRRQTTLTKDFRELVNEIAMLMGYEVSRDLPVEDVEITTPVSKTVQKQLAGKKLAIVPLSINSCKILYKSIFLLKKSGTINCSSSS